MPNVDAAGGDGDNTRAAGHLLHLLFRQFKLLSLKGGVVIDVLHFGNPPSVCLLSFVLHLFIRRTDADGYKKSKKKSNIPFLIIEAVAFFTDHSYQ